jgi:hypothetical protein
MTALAKPSVAMVFGVFFLCAATCAHFDQLSLSPLSIAPDWAAGAFLVGGGFFSRRDWDNGRLYQIAAWAAMVSLLFGSVVGNFEEWVSEPSGGGISGLVSLSQGYYLAIVTALFLISLAALITSLRTR